MVVGRITDEIGEATVETGEIVTVVLGGKVPNGSVLAINVVVLGVGALVVVTVDVGIDVPSVTIVVGMAVVGAVEPTEDPESVGRTVAGTCGGRITMIEGGTEITGADVVLDTRPSINDALVAISAFA